MVTYVVLARFTVRFVPFREEGWAIAKEDEARACAPGAAAGFSGKALRNFVGAAGSFPSIAGLIAIS
jgi:hypothetical protein